MLNSMVFDRGSKADYDLWRDLGNPGWGFDDLLPFFIKVSYYILQCSGLVLRSDGRFLI